jgi:hypothetical protein
MCNSVFRAEWRYMGRTVVIFEVPKKGAPTVTVRPKGKVDGAMKEAAAFWLGEYLPRLTHDERYHLLWA